MHIPYESLVLITASGGAIIVFFIAVAVFCICRHTRRSRKAVIHILSNPSQDVDDVDQSADQAAWERNQLIPTARFLHTLNPKAKICAVGTSKSTWCPPPVQSCALEHSSSTNTPPASHLINHISVDPRFTKTVCEEEKSGSSTSHLHSTRSASGSKINSNNEKVFFPELHTFQEDTVPSQTSSENITHHLKQSVTVKDSVSVPNILSRQIAIHNVYSPELYLIETNKKGQSFHEASTSKETVKPNNVHPLRTKKLNKISNSHRSQPSSSVTNCSISHESPETNYSFHHRYNVKEAKRFESRRVLRSQSFGGRTKLNVESHSHKTEQQQPSHVQNRKLRRNNSVISKTRQDQYSESHRRPSRTQRVLGIKQIAGSNMQGFSNVANNQEPSTSMHPATEPNNVEEVIVLDGTEPPPPYYS